MQMPHPTPEAHQLAAWLEWYALAGVDAMVASDPWLPKPNTPLSKPDPLPLPPKAEPNWSSQPPRAFIKMAETAAQQASTLEELHHAIRQFDGCSLKRTATNTVIGDGNPSSALLLIGEAPGSEEDARGIPFCGKSGQLLDRMLASIGLDRTQCYITNSLYWRPPGNRKPSTEELALCLPFVWRHIELIKPDHVVMVGGTSASSLLNSTLGITRLRGKEHSLTTPYDALTVKAWAIYHPSYLLRQPEHKRYAWQDLLRIKHLARSLRQMP